MAAEVRAESLFSEWRAETKLYLAGISRHQRLGNSSINTQSLVTAAEIQFIPYARSWHTGLVAEYQFSTDNSFRNNLTAGSYLRFDWNRWDTTTFAVVNKTSGSPEVWFYAERVRYRFAENHKLGIVLGGAFRGRNTPTVMLGYYGTISNSLSLNVVAGPVAGGRQDFSARIELVWQVR